VTDSPHSILPSVERTREHELKCWPEFFEEIEQGRKTFEIRENDRDYKVGDVMLLREYAVGVGYSGRHCRRTIGYITDWKQQPRYIVMSLVDETLLRQPSHQQAEKELECPIHPSMRPADCPCGQAEQEKELAAREESVARQQRSLNEVTKGLRAVSDDRLAKLSAAEKQLADQAQEIARLKAHSTASIALADSYERDCAKAELQRDDALQRAIETLEPWLTHGDCPRFFEDTKDEPCVCGLDAALSGLSPSVGSPQNHTAAPGAVK
jgi:hypothetical protein